jgi:transposase
MATFVLNTSLDPTNHTSPEEEETKMARYKKYDYSQAKLLPVSFHKQIQPGSFEFTLSYLIDHKVDLSIFDDLYCNDATGASAYNPAILLKVILLAYSRGIISSRDIERACEENVIFMALSADTRPHFTTISNFISNMKQQVLDIFSDVLLYCNEIGLIGKNMFAIDGCKLPSNASKEWSGTQKHLRHKKEKMEKAIRYIMEKHRNADSADKADINIKEQESQYIETLNRRIKKLENFLKANKDKIGKSGKAINSNITDNESAKMKTSHGVIQGYDGVIAVDAKNQVIVHAEAFGEAQEHNLLKPMVDAVRENFHAIGNKGDVCMKAKLTADAGFNNEANMKMLAENRIDGYVADNQFRKRDPKFADVGKYKERSRKERAKKNGSSHTFLTKDFKFSEDLSYCICPAGRRLYRNGAAIYSKGLHSVRFRGPQSSCLPCHLRANCLRNPQGQGTRQVSYFTGRTDGATVNYTQRMKTKIDSEQGRSIYSKRIGTVEPVFANIRHILKLNRFTMRGREKVNTQWKLFSIVHNMLKIHRFGPAFGGG